MRELVDALPRQWAEAHRAARAWALPRHAERTRAVVCIGMGGSAAAGRLAAAAYRRRLAAPLVTDGQYDLPSWVGRETLVVATSYSGNTEETLSAYDRARRQGARLVAVTSGGELGRRAARDGVPVARVPAGLPPRASWVYLFHPLVRALEWSGALPAGDPGLGRVQGILAGVVRQRARWAGMARVLARRPTLIVAEERLAGVAFRWKTQWNENAKSVAYPLTLPEMHHNEIVGWMARGPLARALAGWALILLRSADEHPRVRIRMAFTKELWRRVSRRVVEVRGVGASPVARVVSLVAMGDHLSVALAEHLRVAAEPVPPIDELKRRLAS